MQGQIPGQPMYAYYVFSTGSLTPCSCSMNQLGQNQDGLLLLKQRLERAEGNTKMHYLNVRLAGLSGSPHVALLNINTTQDALKLRYHLKFLTGDYITAERISADQGTSPNCKLCEAPVESTEHVLTACLGTADTRRRLLPDLLNAVSQVQPSSAILHAQDH